MWKKEAHKQGTKEKIKQFRQQKLDLKSLKGRLFQYHNTIKFKLETIK